MNQYLVLVEWNIPATTKITPVTVYQLHIIVKRVNNSKFTFSNGSNFLGGPDMLLA